MAQTTKFLLSEDAIPTHWVNLLPDLAGTLEDPEFSQDDLDAALAALPEGAPSVA